MRLGLWVWLGVAAGGAQAGSQTLWQAQLRLQEGLDEAAATTIHLPYDWDRLHKTRSGRARFTLEFEVSQPGAEPQALYLPRIGNHFVLRLNGTEVHASDQDASAPEFLMGSQPFFLTLPPAQLRPRNTLEVDLSAAPGQHAGLSEVVVGDVAELLPHYELAHFMEVRSRQILGVFTVVLGLFGLLMWVRLRDRLYLYYGLSEILWTLLTARTMIDQNLLPWPWSAILFYKLPLLLSPPLMYRCLLAILEHEGGRWQRVLNALLIAAPFMAVNAILKWLPLIDSLYMLCLVAFVAALAGLSLVRARRDPRAESLSVALLFVVLLVCGLRDAYVYVLSGDSFTATAWLRFGWIALGLSFAWITVERLRRADLALSQMNDTLSAQLSLRNAELKAAFERERRAEQERGATEERQRLMRDLHDGLGSHLLGLVRLVQTSKSSKSEIATQLQEAIDQMKITVDAMQETEGDIAVMLGAVRYRLAPRLQAAGIRLEWEVPRLPALPDWTARHAYQLQMLLLEAFTNMMNHSGATVGQLSARVVEAPQGRHILIEVRDNGRGFEPARVPGFGKGMQGMKARADSLGALWQVSSEPGCTRLTLRIPIGPEQAAPPGPVAPP